MPQLYGASPEAADAFASVPDGPGVNDPVFREVLNRLELAMQMLRGGLGGPGYFTLEPGGTGAAYTVKVGPFRIAPIVGTAGAKLIESNTEVTLAALPSLAAQPDVWRYLVAYNNAGTLGWALSSTAPQAHGWDSNRQLCFVGAIRTIDVGAGVGAPLSVVRSGRRTLYQRWYDDAGFAISLGGAGTTTQSLATRAPPSARSVRLAVTGVTGPGTAELTEASHTTGGWPVGDGSMVDLPLSAAQEIGFRAIGAAAGCTVRVIGWED